MASLPPLPPRPQELSRPDSLPPPVPPLPPSIRIQEERYNTPSQYESPPHFDRPIAAPRPHRLDPSIPENMARTLDEQVYQPQDFRRPSPALNHTPGFAMPGVGGPRRGMSPLPPPQGSDWSPWAKQVPCFPVSIPASPQRRVSPPGISQSFAELSFSNPNTQHSVRQATMKNSTPKPPSPPSGPPGLTAPLPTLTHLQTALPIIQQPSHDPSLKIAWCRDVFLLIDHFQPNVPASADPIPGPITIVDPALATLSKVAVPIVLQLASITAEPMPSYVAEAVYMRALFASSGSYPEFIRLNPRTAFRDFEVAAKGGYAPAWFRLGRDYESFNDFALAKDCFERGVKLGVESCTYRMGMAHLLGQLGLPCSPEIAIPLLHRAATLASLEVPQPAYVYSLLLLSEFTQMVVPLQLFAPYIPAGSSPSLEARKHLERAGYLHFPPAQYKLGHAYEFAQPPFPFDPLLSVQYYSMASQQGEAEADMALSKWFLCGSGTTEGGGFDRDEALALTFAEKAAAKGLPSAEFAMGYYAEVGVGGPKDVKSAVHWYGKARDHGNTDAGERLAALSQPQPQALSRQEHNLLTENKLIRKRTQAKQRSEVQPVSPPYNGTSFAQMQQQNTHLDPNRNQVIDIIRKTSMQDKPPNTRPAAPSITNTPPPTAYGQSNALPGPAIPRPQKQQQQYPVQQRYTLVDTPVQPSPNGLSAGGPQRNPSPGRQSAHSIEGPAPARRYGPAKMSGGGSTEPNPGGASTGAPPRPQGSPPRPQGSLPQPQGSPPRPQVAPGKGPTTFAEMGFQGAKAEDKECVIM